MSPFENVAPAMSIVTDKGICSYQKHKGGLVVGFSFILFFLLSDIKDHIPSGANYNQHLL